MAAGDADVAGEMTEELKGSRNDDTPTRNATQALECATSDSGVTTVDDNIRVSTNAAKVAHKRRPLMRGS